MAEAEVIMKVLFYSSQKNGDGGKVQSIVEALVPEDSREIHRSLESFSGGFRLSGGDVGVAVLVAASTQNLSDLLSIQNILRDTRIILILPDRKGDTLSLGYKLYPRFVSYADGNFKDVAAVLGKTLNYLNSNNIYQKGE